MDITTLTTGQYMAAALATGWLLDLMFGDPARLPHPVVAFGKWIAMWERKLNKGSHKMAKGAVVAVVSIAMTFGIIKLLDFSLFIDFVELTFLHSLLIFFCLAGTTLRREVNMVFDAVDRSLADGRRQVSRIVGRDTSELSAQEVRTAALETLAENLSDGVIAPLFWLCILGVPGMMAYKMVNTLDSMIGYRNERYKDFGCWAAHIDDIANYIPARITALLMILAYFLYIIIYICKNKVSEIIKGNKNKISENARRLTFMELLRFTFHYGPQHASPNSGWSEAALAGMLGCRFGGPHRYFGKEIYKPHIGKNPRVLTTHDMHISIKICFIAEYLAVAAACAYFMFL